MSTFAMKHELECSPERFWSVFFELEFNEKLFKVLGFPHWKLIDTRETERQIVRTIKATPKIDAPAPVVKLLGSTFGYEEVSTFDKATKVLRFVVKANVLSDKLGAVGTVRCEPRGDGTSLCVVEITTEAKVFGLGGMIESAFERSFRNGWQGSAAFINAWVKGHP